MCGAAAWALSASGLSHFSITTNVSGPNGVWNLPMSGVSVAGPYSMQPCSACTAGILARNSRRMSSRMPDLAVIIAMTWIMGASSGACSWSFLRCEFITPPRAVPAATLSRSGISDRRERDLAAGTARDGLSSASGTRRQSRGARRTGVTSTERQQLGTNEDYHMSERDWRTRAGTTFNCEKWPATGRRGMVVTNHPLASAAGVEMLAAGGNAIDAAIAALFALTVVEPMMVGILGGGIAHIRLADGRHVVIDNQSMAPLAASETTYTPNPNAAPGTMEPLGRKNAIGPTAVATPGNLKGWCEALARFGTFQLADAMEPAIRFASQGFRVTPYLHECVLDCAADMARDAEIAKLYMPGGTPIVAGTRLINGDYAETLRSIARDGPELLYTGTLGALYVQHMARSGGYITGEDLSRYRTIDRDPLHGTYRGFDVVGPPPPASGPLHIIQMLNILEGYDIRALGFGTADTLHLLAEVLKIAFADRAAATADPAFVKVPVQKLLSKSYAGHRRTQINPGRAQSWTAEVAPGEGANTTHLTVADAAGNIVASTQTINSLFGARYLVPGTGMIPNNYMFVFTPHPSRANSVAPGKRITSSMSPVMVLRDGKPRYALGLPGGLRIFPSVMQAISNLIDHGMSLQEAVEASRLWTQGWGVEVERSVPANVLAQLRARGHEVEPTGNVGGGMNAIAFEEDGTLTGAACWRADGTAIGIGGGYARKGVRFRPEASSGENRNELNPAKSRTYGTSTE